MRQFFLIIIGVGLVIQLSGQTGANKLRERIYMQTDKRLYLAGEQVRMKLLTVDTEQIPLVFSKVAYVELVEDTIARTQIKVALSNGTGEGLMQLPADLPTGFYRLIAYTRFMRNEGEQVFFEKNLAIVNTFQPVYSLDKTVITATPPGNNTDANPMSYPGNISSQTDKKTYSKREHGVLTITGLPENIHTLSVSIAGKDLITEGMSLQNNGLPETVGITEKFIPEIEGHILTGRIIDNQSGQAVSAYVPLTTGLSFPGEGLRFFTGQNLETGDVLFRTSFIAGTIDVATVIYDPNNKYRIDIVSPFVTRFHAKQMPALPVDSAGFSLLLARSVALQVSHYFGDDPFGKRFISEPSYKLKPTNSYRLDEYTRFTSMRELFIEFISNARFQRTGGKWELSVYVNQGANSYYGTMPLILLDGAPISNHDLIYNYDPLLIERINIYNYLCYFGGNAFEGIVELKTYRGLMQGVTFDKSTQIIPYEGPQSYRKTLFPDYSAGNNRNDRMPDSRHTLLWEPDVRAEGKPTIVIPFDTSDLPGEYQVTVEGITNEGQFIRTKNFFLVE